MPDASQFLSGFGLLVGSSFGGFILSNAVSTHESIKRYQEYKYIITLTFTNSGSGIYEDLYRDLLLHITQTPIIYGIRNPYRCTIDLPKYGDIEGDDNVTIFHLTGHSMRVH